MRIGQAIDMMKLQMAEMKELLEGKVHELQAKLAEEKKKSDSDVAQWKAMAQKELKTRLQVRWTPPSCLQLRLNLTWPHTHTHTRHNPARVGEGGAAEGAAGGQATEPDPVGWARGADAVGRVVAAGLIAVEPEELRQVAERPAAQSLLTPLAGRLPGAAVGGRRRARGRR
jgi:hypothetical protein